jgi:hypothetical protein
MGQFLFFRQAKPLFLINKVKFKLLGFLRAIQRQRLKVLDFVIIIANPMLSESIFVLITNDHDGVTTVCFVLQLEVNFVDLLLSWVGILGEGYSEFEELFRDVLLEIVVELLVPVLAN